MNDDPKTPAVFGLSGFMAALLVGAFLVSAGCASSIPVAGLENPRGKVEVKPEANGVFRPGKSGDQMASGGAVRTGEDGEATLVFTDGLKVRMWPDSHFRVTGTAHIGHQASGSVLFTVPRSPVQRTIETPNGLTTITGTVFAQEVAPQSISILLDEGKVAFTDKQGNRRDLEPGQQLVATLGEPLPAAASIPESLRRGIFHPSGPDFLKGVLNSRPFIQQF